MIRMVEMLLTIVFLAALTAVFAIVSALITYAMVFTVMSEFGI